MPLPREQARRIEGIALPLVHTAWITALGFTVLNAVLLLGFRIPVEERALALAGEPGAEPTPDPLHGADADVPHPA